MKLGWITDEVFLGRCIKKKQKFINVHYLERCRQNPFQIIRIDRSNWHINILNFPRGKYIDSQLLRPLSKHKNNIVLLELYVNNNNNAAFTLIIYYISIIVNKFKLNKN